MLKFDSILQINFLSINKLNKIKSTIISIYGFIYWNPYKENEISFIYCITWKDFGKILFSGEKVKPYISMKHDSSNTNFTKDENHWKEKGITFKNSPLTRNIINRPIETLSKSINNSSS